MVDVLVDHILKNVSDVFLGHEAPDYKANDAEEEVEEQVQIEESADGVILGVAVDLNCSVDPAYK